MRNLTPQSLLLTITLIAGRHINDFSDLNNPKEKLIFFMFLGMFLAAFWANSYIFVEDYLLSAKKVNDYSKELRDAEIKGFKYLKALLFFAFKKDKRIFYETAFVYLILLFALALVVWSAVLGATSALKTFAITK